MSQTKKRVAVFFGGRSPEHDVSVVTGLQILKAVDQSKFDAFPVYITIAGEWLVGDVLREKNNYMLDANARKQTQQVTLDVTARGKGRLVPVKKSLFGGAQDIEFDVALPCFHGLFGEDGNMQGLFEVANIPYAGARTMGSAVFMDKVVTKYAMQALDIPCLPYAVLHRPDQGYMIPADEIAEATKHLKFPCIVKPVHLGSSIGVAKVNAPEEIVECLPAVFEQDNAVLVEPFVQNMVEYNVAVARFGGEVRTSAIERPKASDELLDFKQKYLSGGDNKSGTKTSGQSSEGMLSLTRELNPKLSKEIEGKIREWAGRLFEGLDGTGAPRIDFICDSKSGEIWMNEVNPWPGSIGYFLWEAAEEPMLFTELMTALIDEAFLCHRRARLPKDPVPVDARLLRRGV